MKEKRDIDSLFEAAKNEPPKVSFEKVANHFSNATSWNIGNWAKEIIQTYPNLNLFIMTTFGIIIGVAIWLNSGVDSENVLQVSKDEVAVTVFDSARVGENNLQELKKVNPAKKLPKNEDLEKPAIQRPQLAITQRNIPIEAELKDDSDSLEFESKSELKNANLAPEEVSDSTNSKDSETSINNVVKEDSPLTIDEDHTDLKDAFPRKEPVFLILKTDDNQTVQSFIKDMKAYQMNVRMDLSFTRDNKFIQKMDMHFLHPKGLNWKVKITGFEQIEFKLELDEDGNPGSISYRFDPTKEFSKPLPLDTKGTIESKLTLGGKMSKVKNNWKQHNR